jgi:transposase
MQIVFPISCRYYLHSSFVDMRKGFDGLCGIVRNEFNLSPLSGQVFIFLNRRRDLVKILHWQGDGFALFYKRLERGTFELPANTEEKSGAGLLITSHQLQFILAGIQLSSIKKRNRFERKIVDSLL